MKILLNRLISAYFFGRVKFPGFSEDLYDAIVKEVEESASGFIVNAASVISPERAVHPSMKQSGSINLDAAENPRKWCEMAPGAWDGRGRYGTHAVGPVG